MNEVNDKMAKVLELRPTRQSASADPGIAGRLSHVLAEWVERSRVRAELRRMSDDLLVDCGLNPALARIEANRLFLFPLRLDRARRDR
ncbi:MAG: DUF1127 domain-containing protein [Pseudomonadota bacterium]